MPQAVVHVLFAIIALDLFRDHVLKNKRELPLHYVFLGGVAGLLPDIDVPLFWLLNNLLGIDIPWFHRGFTHTFFFAGIFLIGALLFYNYNKKLSKLFEVVTFGIVFHIFLDFIFMGVVTPFYPLSNFAYGIDLFGRINLPLAAEGFEALVLLAWLWHEERHHRISDFI